MALKASFWNSHFQSSRNFTGSSLHLVRALKQSLAQSKQLQPSRSAHIYNSSFQLTARCFAITIKQLLCGSTHCKHGASKHSAMFSGLGLVSGAWW